MSPVLESAARTIAAVSATAARVLDESGVANAARESREMVAHVLGVSRSLLDARGRDPWPATADRRLAAMLQQRREGWPLAYLIGEWDFRDLTLTVTPNVLIPRPETEELFEEMERDLRGLSILRLADIGTGAGGLAISAARSWPAARVWAVDLSEATLAVARWNARRWRVEDRIDFRCGDLFAPLLSEPLDAVVANLPYVSRAEFAALSPEVRREPVLALDGGPDGLSVFRRFVPQAATALAPGGRVFLETGQGQTRAVAGLLAAAGFQEIRIGNDSAGRDRFVRGRRCA